MKYANFFKLLTHINPYLTPTNPLLKSYRQNENVRNNKKSLKICIYAKKVVPLCP